MCKLSRRSQCTRQWQRKLKQRIVRGSLYTHQHNHFFENPTCFINHNEISFGFFSDLLFSSNPIASLQEPCALVLHLVRRYSSFPWRKAILRYSRTCSGVLLGSNAQRPTKKGMFFYIGLSLIEKELLDNQLLGKQLLELLQL